MAKNLIKYSIVPLLAFPLFALAQNNGVEHFKPATDFTKRANEAVYATLNFADSLDWIGAKKGFIATVENGIVKTNSGATVVNENDYAFIKGKSPATVNPAPWRHAQINDINGCSRLRTASIKSVPLILQAWRLSKQKAVTLL